MRYLIALVLLAGCIDQRTEHQKRIDAQAERFRRDMKTMADASVGQGPDCRYPYVTSSRPIQSDPACP